MKAMLYRRRGSGDVWRIDEQRFMLRDQVAALAARAAALAKEVGGRGFTVAQYRDATGIGRNHVIRILEFFDSIGVTRRDGDCRKVRPDYHLVVGSRDARIRRTLDKPEQTTAPYSWKRNIPGGVPGLQTRRKVPCIFGRFDSYLFRHCLPSSLPLWNRNGSMHHLARLDEIVDSPPSTPLASRTDKEGRFPREAIQALGEAGLLGLTVPTRVAAWAWACVRPRK